MSINWFPGHMHKARKEMAEVMPQVDVIIEVIDARIPFSSENPLVNSLRENTPCIKLLNKADLADPAITELWITEMEKQSGIRALPVSSQKPDQFRQLLQIAESLLPERNLELRPARAMIMGIPNVGKSTIINILAGRIIARTGNEAGITKAQQRIKLENGIMLTDTPGFLWPKLTPPSCGYRLAITGAIKETAFDYGDIAFFATEYLMQAYPERLKARYGLTEIPESDLETLEEIGRLRGCARKGGGVDIQKVSTLLINELRAGHLGAITFETPEMTYKEVIDAKAADEKKAREKEIADEIRRLKTKKNRR